MTVSDPLRGSICAGAGPAVGVGDEGIGRGVGRGRGRGMEREEENEGGKRRGQYNVMNEGKRGGVRT